MDISDQLKRLEIGDPFWYNDFQILKKRPVEFVPTNSMNIIEKLNAITRFSIYFGLLLTISTGEYLALYITIAGFALTLLIYHNHPKISADNNNRLVGGGDFGPIPNNQKTQPTRDNPYMNVLMNEYTENPHRPPADEHDDPEVQKSIENYFQSNLYRDVDDVWGRNNSQRQFYTMPSTTIPNDRDSFMKWAFKTPYVCKDGDKLACTGLELSANHRHGAL